MRTTIRLDDELFAEIKQFAARQGKTLTSVIEDALRVSMALQQEQQDRGRVRLPTFGGNGPLPGVALDNSAELLDLMERHDSG